MGLCPRPLSWGLPCPPIRASSPGSPVGHSDPAPAPLSPLPDLEQKILQVLRDAGSPVKTVQLVKECQVPKKDLNRTLYRLKKESQVALAGTATWRLGGPGTGEPVSTELALPRNGNLPSWGAGGMQHQ